MHALSARSLAAEPPMHSALTLNRVCVCECVPPPPVACSLGIEVHDPACNSWPRLCLFALFASRAGNLSLTHTHTNTLTHTHIPTLRQLF